MQREVLLPQVELTMESVLISKWLVRAGERVNAQQPLVEVETQKATSEVPSPAAGYVRQLCVEEGQMVREKAMLCILTDTADEPLQAAAVGATSSQPNYPSQESSPPLKSLSDAARVKASPAARRIARELNVDMSAVNGSGPGGRITEEDVRTTASGRGPTPEDDSWSPLPASRVTLIAQMQRSLAEIPQIHIRRRLDVTPLSIEAPKITFTHRLVKAAATALMRHPPLRTIVDANRIRVEPVSVAVAMDSPHGLVAPVVRNADQLSLEKISSAIINLRAKAEANSLQRTELINGPFAISNLGMFGVDQFDAFVFHGQTAVLSVGRATEDANRKLVWFGLAADHRIVDGAEAARFLETLQQEILSV